MRLQSTVQSDLDSAKDRHTAGIDITPMIGFNIYRGCPLDGCQNRRRRKSSRKYRNPAILDFPDKAMKGRQVFDSEQVPRIWSGSDPADNFRCKADIGVGRQ